MRVLRATRRLAGLLLVSFVFEVLWLLGTLPARALGRGEPWRSFVFRTWSRGAMAGMGVRVETRGVPPRPPYLLVSNHLGYLDVAVFAHALGPVFVAKAEVRRWPVIGWLARSMSSVFVNREQNRDLVRAGAAILDVVERGRGVVLFAEGTSTRGAEVLAFQPSLLAPAARKGWEVHHASIRFATVPGDPPASLAAAWWGDMTFVPHFWKLLSLRSVRARIVFGEGAIRDPDRKSLARRLHQAVVDHFEPLDD